MDPCPWVCQYKLYELLKSGLFLMPNFDFYEHNSVIQEFTSNTCRKDILFIFLTSHLVLDFFSCTYPKEKQIRQI